MKQPPPLKRQSDPPFAQNNERLWWIFAICGALMGLLLVLALLLVATGGMTRDGDGSNADAGDGTVARQGAGEIETVESADGNSPESAKSAETPRESDSPATEPAAEPAPEPEPEDLPEEKGSGERNESRPVGDREDPTADADESSSRIPDSESEPAEPAVAEAAPPASATIGSFSQPGSFKHLVWQMKHNGLDVVMVLDSTSSMAPEIDQAKLHIEKIGSTLFKLVPSTRVSICTYRDHGDSYVARGLPLTSDQRAINNYLANIFPGGGGDGPEAVEAGMAWSLENNRFRPKAHKVMLVVGDAPPHAAQLDICKQLARKFGRKDGTVSTVTCRGSIPLPEFDEIAKAGGGESFLNGDDRKIMTELMVLIFGSKHREKVIEAFKIMDKG